MPVARRRRPARGGDIDEAVIAWRPRPNDFRLGTAEVIQAIIRYSPRKITTLIIEELYRGGLCGAEHYRAAGSYP